MTMADTLSPVGAVVVHRQSGDKPGQLRFRHCGSGGHRIRKRTHGVRTVRARCAHGSGNTPQMALEKSLGIKGLCRGSAEFPNARRSIPGLQEKHCFSIGPRNGGPCRTDRTHISRIWPGGGGGVESQYHRRRPPRLPMPKAPSLANGRNSHGGAQ